MIKKITTRELRPGMVVATLRADIWLQSPSLYTTPGVIESEEQVRRIIDAGFLETFIEFEEEPAGSPEPEVRSGRTTYSKVSLGEELHRAREIYAGALQAAAQLFARAQRGGPLELRQARKAVASLERSVDRNAAALACLACFSEARTHLYVHAVNTAIFAMFAAGRFGLRREEVLNIGLAALMHDLGKSKLPSDLVCKCAERMAPDQRKVLRSHCVQGLSILDDCAEMPRAVKRAVAEHHERWDGQGYPFGLKGEQISQAGRILSLANCYDGLTGKRPYRDPISPNRALSRMFRMRGKEFSPDDVDRFIKHLGVYPSGSLVRLTDGRVGVVCEVDPAEPLSPLVNVVLDERMNPLTCTCVDLLCDDDLKIIDCIDDPACRADLLELLAAGAA